MPGSQVSACCANCSTNASSEIRTGRSFLLTEKGQACNLMWLNSRGSLLAALHHRLAMEEEQVKS